MFFRNINDHPLDSSASYARGSVILSLSLLYECQTDFFFLPRQFAVHWPQNGAISSVLTHPSAEIDTKQI
jgi:hypothetical protein